MSSENVAVDRTMVRCSCGCPPYSECNRQLDGVRGAPCGHGRHPFWEENGAKDFRLATRHEDGTLLHTVHRVFILDPSNNEPVYIEHFHCPTCNLTWKDYSRAEQAISSYLSRHANDRPK
jgi:hypothetical protein